MHTAIDERPQLSKVLDQLRPGDTLVVWKLDRLGRSLRHLIDTITDLQQRDVQQRDVGFRSMQENIDTTTPGGKLIFHIFGALAEFVRGQIRLLTPHQVQRWRTEHRLDERLRPIEVDRVTRSWYTDRPPAWQ